MINLHRNQLLTIVKGNGIEPRDFHYREEFDDQYQTVLFTIYHKATTLRFVVMHKADDIKNFRWSYTVYNGGVAEVLKGPFPLDNSYTNFESVTDGFDGWLDNEVKVGALDQTLPDLWQQALSEGEAKDVEEFEPFSEIEKTQVRLSINQFKLLMVAEFKPDQSQMDVIIERL